MLHKDTIEKIAASLFRAEKEGFEVDKFVDQYPDLNADLAYHVQERLIELKCEAEQTIRTGRKLGLTSVAKQQMMGVHEPVYGVLLESMQMSEHTPVSLEPFIHPKIEPEIAFVFKRELKGPSVSVPEVLDATAYVMPALEIIDSRYQNFSFTLADVIADNSSSSRFILGGPCSKPDNTDLQLTGMVFKKNGRVISTSTGASVMGHPARAIAWLVNKLAQVGQSIAPGEIVLSGALCEAISITDGDVITMSLDGIGSVSTVFTK
ncbi:2-keto-4-pentenoate hydratase [Brevibacillus sp. 179-C9.3 HS]|uniref:2-keto-4-pentenoate hydratase n=1 Tax=unclassified Brevibacillus TaxID=2684853 RepID=UPI0039A07634